ncbi:fimbrial protein, partial [Aeromonas jandaei]
TATITWAGNLTSNGLGNTGGKANDAWVELKGVNSKVVGTKITSSTASVEFDSDEITKNGAKFAATLTGGTVVGDFKSATAFVVAYN